jgi:hypothetical protein
MHAGCNRRIKTPFSFKSVKASSCIFVFYSSPVHVSAESAGVCLLDSVKELYENFVFLTGKESCGIALAFTAHGKAIFGTGIWVIQGVRSLACGNSRLSADCLVTDVSVIA